MFRLVVFLAALASCCTAAPNSYTTSNLLDRLKVNPSINLPCILESCIPALTGCALSQQCRAAIECSEGCFKNWDKDPSAQKFVVQNCTNKCSFTYGDEPSFQKFMFCMTEHKCASFPPIPDTCKRSTVKPVKQLTLSDIQGKWWVIRGHHEVYDCYPCQTLEFDAINSTAWLYSPRYEVYLVNGSLFYEKQKFVMPLAAAGQEITFTYQDVGLEHTETWWLVDMAEDKSYAQMYYCGNTLQWFYEGALVFARERTLNSTQTNQIAAAYKEAVGLDLKSFCHPDTSQKCPN